MDRSSPGSSVHRILQTRILEWIAMPSSRESSQPRDQTLSLRSPALAGGFFTTSTTWEAPRLSGNVLISKLTNRMSEVQSTSACEQAGLTPHWEKMAPSTVALQPSSRDANRNGDSISMGHVSSQNRAHSCIYASGSTAASHTEGLQQMCSAPWTD